jgi:nicotinate-nucleotide--dimethylbenzimidazole phosphoribosyltransferase
MACVRERLASLAKPPGSLGVLEDWATTLCEVQETLNPEAEPATVLVFCADHGCKKADDSLSPYPRAVTQAVFRSLAAGISGTAVLARTAGAALAVVDVGIDGDLSCVKGAAEASPAITVRSHKVAMGTADLRHGPAMDEQMIADALKAGAAVVAAEHKRGVRVVCVGEVGIGNTTSSSALLAALTGKSASECCGRGTGLDDAGLAHKISTVEQALAVHKHAVAAAPGSNASPEELQVQAREALRCLGGLEIAAMAGAYMEASQRKMVAVVDGSISAVAALCACRMYPSCRRAMLFATALAEEPSAGRGGEILEQALDATPALHMGMRLGEGSGAALALPMVRAAAAIVKEMGTLQDALALCANA